MRLVTIDTYRTIGSTEDMKPVRCPKCKRIAMYLGVEHGGTAAVEVKCGKCDHLFVVMRETQENTDRHADNLTAALV